MLMAAPPLLLCPPRYPARIIKRRVAEEAREYMQSSIRENSLLCGAATWENKTQAVIEANAMKARSFRSLPPSMFPLYRARTSYEAIAERTRSSERRWLPTRALYAPPPLPPAAGRQRLCPCVATLLLLSRRSSPTRCVAAWPGFSRLFRNPAVPAVPYIIPPGARRGLAARRRARAQRAPPPARGPARARVRGVPGRVPQLVRDRRRAHGAARPPQTYMLI